MKADRFTYYLFLAAILFIVAGIFLAVYSESKTNDKETFVSTVSDNLEKQIDLLQRDVVDAIAYLESNNKASFEVFPLESTCPYYVFKNGQLIFWSDHHYVPEYRLLKGQYKIKYVRTLRKEFLSRRWNISDSKYEVFGIIPLFENYKLENNYVSSGYNSKIFADQSVQTLNLSAEIGHEVCLEQCLFKVAFRSGYQEHQEIFYAIIGWVLFTGIVLLGIALFFKSLIIARRNMPKGALLLAGGLIIIRAVMLLCDFPERFIALPLFDSKYFASSVLNPSLGDLLLNIICTAVLALFVAIHFRRLMFHYKLLHLKSRFNILTILLSAALPTCFLVIFLVFQTIYHNSQLTFDIKETIYFGTNRTVAFIIFILLSSSVFIAHHMLFSWLGKLTGKKQFLLYYLAGVVLFALINLLIDQDFEAALVVSIAYVCIVHFTRLFHYLSKIKYNTFLYIFFGIVASSVTAAWAIFEFENERKTDQKHKFATQFLIENDHLAEYLLSEINENLKSDAFIQSRMASPFFSKDIIRSKIRQVYLSNYFDKYDINIYLYNIRGQSFEGDKTELKPKDIQAFNVDQYKTRYPGIYFINKLGGEVAKRYLNFIEIKKRGILVGYIILDLRLKRVIPENVYPELLVDNRFLFPYQDVSYSYAVFDNTEVVFHSGSFNYFVNFDPGILKGSTIYKDGVRQGSYTHYAVMDGQGRVVVISSAEHHWVGFVSNFSFLFLIQVFTLLVITLFAAAYFSFQKVNLNYSARIQLYLNIAFFLPLFVVSITTLSLINSSFKKEVNEEYYKKARTISSNISGDLDQYIASLLNDTDELSSKLSQIAKFSGVDINLFNKRGRLIATSQPLIYENNLISRYINPVAMVKIGEQEESSYVARENVGTLSFNTTYFNIKSFETGDLIGILSIPFFQSEYALEQNQIEVLSNVINIFTVIFIVFLLISYLAAKWLTFPLTFITQKLKKTTLTGFNEPLNWPADDEIGLMVSEYNRMLVNLEESKKALAKTEKESAWRAIAQQVAHEIKNPLTPMKLTLQHLSRKLTGKKDGNLEKPINTLLHQIETLNDIASSFSSFAKMPIPENERFDISEVVKNTVQLYKADNHVNISLQLPHESVYTKGDEQLMSRILSNILLNASQSTDNVIVDINVCLTVINPYKLLLEVSDNGPGIDEAIQSKIFVPNFSTKETGSGIGLAIAKHGIEHAGGKIYFETSSKGTSFFIELPLVE